MKVKCVNLQGLGKLDGCTYISTTVSVAKVCYKSNQWSLRNQNHLRLHKWSNHLHKSDFKCNKLLQGNSNPSDHPSSSSVKQESRNPPSAAYAAQEAPNRQPHPIDVIDENGAMRAVSPSPRTADQIKGLNAAYVPRGWMILQATFTGFILEWETTP